MEQHLLASIQTLYLGSFLGLIAFLLIWEGGKPRVAFSNGAARWRHVGRNLAIFASVLLFADYLVGVHLLPTQNYLLEPPRIFLEGSRWPWPVQIGVAFLAADLLDYLMHRLGHRYSLIWRLHSVHHSDRVLDASTAGRTHPLEVTLHVAARLLLYVLLGLPIWIEGLRSILHNATVMLQHANVTFPAWLERLSPVLVTPGMHHLHHDTRRELHDANYGLMFSFWDRLFGTYVSPEKARVERTGLDGYESISWQSVSGMLLTPIRAFPDTTLPPQRQ